MRVWRVAAVAFSTRGGCGHLKFPKPPSTPVNSPVESVEALMDYLVKTEETKEGLRKRLRLLKQLRYVDEKYQDLLDELLREWL